MFYKLAQAPDTLLFGDRAPCCFASASLTRGVCSLDSPWRQVMDAPKKEITPEHLLLSAALAGDTSTVQTLINSGISVNSKGDKVAHQLLELAPAGLLKRCHYWCGGERAPGEQLPHTHHFFLAWTPSTFFSCLIPFIMTTQDYTALHNATRNGHTALVEMLVAHKADVNAKTNAQVGPPPKL